MTPSLVRRTQYVISFDFRQEFDDLKCGQEDSVRQTVRVAEEFLVYLLWFQTWLWWPRSGQTLSTADRQVSWRVSSLSPLISDMSLMTPGLVRRTQYVISFDFRHEFDDLKSGQEDLVRQTVMLVEEFLVYLLWFQTWVWWPQVWSGGLTTLSPLTLDRSLMTSSLVRRAQYGRPSG